MTPVIELDRVMKSYRVGPIRLDVLTEISFVVAPGQVIAITGSSGSGKSTLLNLLGLLDHPDSGTYRIDGREVGSASDDERTLLRNRKLGFVFQQSPMFPRLTAEENVAVPLLYRGDSRAVAATAAREQLARLGLSALAPRYPSQLSGGQLKCVALARALVGKPKVILADEPTAGLDETTADQVMSLLLDTVRASAAALILITHQVRDAARADRHVVLRDGTLCNASQLFASAVPA